MKNSEAKVRVECLVDQHFGMQGLGKEIQQNEGYSRKARQKIDAGRFKEKNDKKCEVFVDQNNKSVILVNQKQGASSNMIKGKEFHFDAIYKSMKELQSKIRSKFKKDVASKMNRTLVIMNTQVNNITSSVNQYETMILTVLAEAFGNNKDPVDFRLEVFSESGRYASKKLQLTGGVKQILNEFTIRRKAALDSFTQQGKPCYLNYRAKFTQAELSINILGVTPGKDKSRFEPISFIVDRALDSTKPISNMGISPFKKSILEVLEKPAEIQIIALIQPEEQIIYTTLKSVLVALEQLITIRTSLVREKKKLKKNDRESEKARSDSRSPLSGSRAIMLANRINKFRKKIKNASKSKSKSQQSKSQVSGKSKTSKTSRSKKSAKNMIALGANIAKAKKRLMKRKADRSDNGGSILTERVDENMEVNPEPTVKEKKSKSMNPKLTKMQPKFISFMEDEGNISNNIYHTSSSYLESLREKAHQIETTPKNPDRRQSPRFLSNQIEFRPQQQRIEELDFKANLFTSDKHKSIPPTLDDSFSHGQLELPSLPLEKGQHIPGPSVPLKGYLPDYKDSSVSSVDSRIEDFLKDTKKLFLGPSTNSTHTREFDALDDSRVAWGKTRLVNEVRQKEVEILNLQNKVQEGVRIAKEYEKCIQRVNTKKNEWKAKAKESNHALREAEGKLLVEQDRITSIQRQYNETKFTAENIKERCIYIQREMENLKQESQKKEEEYMRLLEIARVETNSLTTQLSRLKDSESLFTSTSQNLHSKMNTIDLENMKLKEQVRVMETNLSLSKKENEGLEMKLKYENERRVTLENRLQKIEEDIINRDIKKRYTEKENTAALAEQASLKNENERLKREVAIVQNQEAELLKSNNLMKNEISKFEQENRRLKLDNADLEGRLNNHANDKQIINDKSTENKKLQSEVRNLQSELEERDKALRLASEEFRLIEGDIVAFQNLKLEINDLNTSLRARSKEVETLTELNLQLKSELSLSKTSNISNSSIIADLKAKLTSLEENLASTQSLLNIARSDMESSAHQANQNKNSFNIARSELRHVRKQLSELEIENERLNSEMNKVKNAMEHNKALKEKKKVLVDIKGMINQHRVKLSSNFN